MTEEGRKAWGQITTKARKSRHSMKDLSDALGRAAKLTSANRENAQQSLTYLRENLDDSTCGLCERVRAGEGSPQDIKDQETISGLLESLDEVILEFD